MKFSIEILETNKVIQSLVLKAMSSELKVGFLKARIHIQQDAKKIFIEAITSSPEYLSLVSGDLKGHLGVPDASSRMAEIIRVWTDSIVLTIRTPKPVGRLIKGGMVLSLIKDWQRALTSGSASFLTQKGQSLPWLEWLLLAGDSQFIVDYDVDLDLSQAQRANSRTGDFK